MEDRIKGSGADLVSVPGKLFCHACSEDGFMPGVMQDVKTDHAGVKIAVIRIAIHYLISLSKYDSTSTNSIDGRDYYVRKMKNLKASIPIEWLTGDSFNFYGWACGAFLARVHARVGYGAHRGILRWPALDKP